MNLESKLAKVVLATIGLFGIFNGVNYVHYKMHNKEISGLTLPNPGELDPVVMGGALYGVYLAKKNYRRKER